MAALSNYSTEKLFDSIFSGEDEVTIQALLQEGADINARDSYGFSPLLLASLLDRKELVPLLIMSGANVNAKFLGNWTALHCASGSNWIEIVRALVKKISDINVRDNRGETALHYAARSGCLEVVKCLIEKGADIDLRNIRDFTPLLCAADNRRLEVVNLLLNYQANVGDGYGLLYYASRNGWIDLVCSVVKIIPDLNEWHVFGQTALHVASMIGHLEIVKRLVKEGTNINNRNDCGYTPLHLASTEGHPEIVEWLVENGINIEIRNKAAETALHVASINRNLEIVKYLVQRNCDLDARNIWGRTALANACAVREFNIAQYLLQAGASWDIEFKNGISLLSYLAMEELEFKFFKLFIENGAYLKCVDYEAMVKSSSLKVLQDEELCSQSIVNRFNKDLLELYQFYVSRSLPRFEKMKIKSGTEVVRAIKRTVGLEIQRKGHCNVLKVRPMVLSVLSVRSLLEYCEKKKSELRNSFKRPAAFDSNSNKCQRSSKGMRLS